MQQLSLTHPRTALSEPKEKKKEDEEKGKRKREREREGEREREEGEKGGRIIDKRVEKGFQALL